MTDSIPEAAAGVDAGASASQAMDEHDLLVLARVAGLHLSGDRAAGLAREYSNTLAAVHELDALLTDQSSIATLAFGPYDPAWSDESTGGTGASR